MARRTTDRITADDVAHLDPELAGELLAAETEETAPPRRQPPPKLDPKTSETKRVVCVVDTLPWGIVRVHDEDGARFVERPLKHREQAEVRADAAAILERNGQVVIVA
jgi:hypothetical protein